MSMAIASFSTFGLEKENHGVPSNFDFKGLPIDVCDGLLEKLEFKDLWHFRQLCRECFWVGRDKNLIRLSVLLANCPPFRHVYQEDWGILHQQLSRVRLPLKGLELESRVENVYLKGLACLEGLEKMSSKFEDCGTAKGWWVSPLQQWPIFSPIKKYLDISKSVKAEDLPCLQKVKELIQSWIAQLQPLATPVFPGSSLQAMLSTLAFYPENPSSGSIWIHRKTGSVIGVQGKDAPCLYCLNPHYHQEKMASLGIIEVQWFTLQQKIVYLFHITITDFEDWTLSAEETFKVLKMHYLFKKHLAELCQKKIHSLPVITYTE